MPNNFLSTCRRRVDYFEILAVAAILLGFAIIGGIVFTYDVSRHTDDAQALAALHSAQLPDDL